MTNIRTITLEDGKLTKTGNTWTYTGSRGTYTGSTISEVLAEVYGVNPSDVEVKVVRFRDYGVKALICIEGLCELYDVELEESTPPRTMHRKHESVRTN
jgi:hypothetical protein